METPLVAPPVLTGTDADLLAEANRLRAKMRAEAEANAARRARAVAESSRGPRPSAVAGLAQRRVEAGLTQAEVAEAVGVSQRVVSYWERGERRPSRHAARLLDRLFGLTPPAPAPADAARAVVEANRVTAARIRRRREARGWSQADLARAVGLDHSAVSRLESGDRTPRLETLAAIAAAFGCRPSDLLP